MGISWHKVTCLGKLAIIATAYYEIATPYGLAMTQKDDGIIHRRERIYAFRNIPHIRHLR